MEDMAVSKTVGKIAVWVRTPPCAPEDERGYVVTEKEISITVDNKVIDNLHNAIVAYLGILDRCYLGLELPGKFEKLAELSDEEIDESRHMKTIRSVQNRG